MGPAAQPAQGIESAVDGGGAPAGGEQMLAIGDQVVFAEAIEREAVVLNAGAPGEEMEQVVAVAAPRRRGEIGALKVGEESVSASPDRMRPAAAAAVLHAMSSPALDPWFIACNMPGLGRHSMQVGLHAIIARNKPPVRGLGRNGIRRFARYSTLSTSLTSDSARMGLPTH